MRYKTVYSKIVNCPICKNDELEEIENSISEDYVCNDCGFLMIFKNEIFPLYDED